MFQTLGLRCSRTRIGCGQGLCIGRQGMSHSYVLGLWQHTQSRLRPLLARWHHRRTTHGADGMGDRNRAAVSPRPPDTRFRPYRTGSSGLDENLTS